MAICLGKSVAHMVGMLQRDCRIFPEHLGRSYECFYIYIYVCIRNCVITHVIHVVNAQYFVKTMISMFICCAISFGTV